MRDHSLLLYTAGQISAVLSRPFALFLTNNYLSKEAADGLAVIFLASTLGLAAIAADPHRRFYPRAFGSIGPVNGLPLFLYVGTLTVTMGLGGGLVLAMGLGLATPLLVACSGSLYFLSEKCADEVLRFRLFEGRLGAWGQAMGRRAVFQLAGVGGLVLWRGDALPAWMLVMAFTTGNLMVFLPEVPHAIWRLLRPTRILTLIWLIKRGWRWLAGNWTLWVLALMTSGIAYLDRCIAVFVDRDLFPLFMLVAMCLSVVPMMVGAYFLNRNRRAFLERRFTGAGVLTSRQFLGLLGAGLLGGGMASATALVFSRNGDQFPISYVLVIAVLQVLVAVIAVLREIPYWAGSITLMLRVEGGFYLLTACALLIGWWAHLTAVWVFAAVIGCVMVRLIAYLAISSPSHLLRAGMYSPIR